MTITVMIADDQFLVRAGLRAMLEDVEDIEVVADAADGVEAVALAQRLHPDVVLMDVRMPRLDGIEATRRILDGTPLGQPATKVIVLTTFDLDEYVYAGLRAGAGAFLLKDALADDIIAAIRAVVVGDVVIAPSATKRLVERFLHHPSPRAVDPAPLQALTPREREVLTLIAEGLTNAEIAGRCFLAEGTVKTHVGRILGKLGLRDRVQAVVLAYETGLVRPGA